MTLGGVIYDPQLMQKGANLLGLGMTISREETLALADLLHLNLRSSGAD